MARIEIRLALAFALGFALVGQASAQTTRCVREGREVVCRTDEQRPNIWDTPLTNSAEAYQQGRNNADRAMAARTAQQVGRLIAAGDCVGARNAALTSGDLALAKQVQDICQPANGR